MTLTETEVDKIVLAFFKVARGDLRPDTIHGLRKQIDKKYSRQAANALEYMKKHNPPLLIRYNGEWHATQFRHNCMERGCIIDGKKKRNGEEVFILDMVAFSKCINYWMRLEWVVEGIIGDFHKYSLGELWQGLKGALGGKRDENRK